MEFTVETLSLCSIVQPVLLGVKARIGVVLEIAWGVGRGLRDRVVPGGVGGDAGHDVRRMRGDWRQGGDHVRGVGGHPGVGAVRVAQPVHHVPIRGWIFERIFSVSGWLRKLLAEPARWGIWVPSLLFLTGEIDIDVQKIFVAKVLFGVSVGFIREHVVSGEVLILTSQVAPVNVRVSWRRTLPGNLPILDTLRLLSVGPWSGFRDLLRRSESLSVPGFRNSGLRRNLGVRMRWWLWSVVVCSVHRFNHFSSVLNVSGPGGFRSPVSVSLALIHSILCASAAVFLTDAIAALSSGAGRVAGVSPALGAEAQFRRAPVGRFVAEQIAGASARSVSSRARWSGGASHRVFVHVRESVDVSQRTEGPHFVQSVVERIVWSSDSDAVSLSPHSHSHGNGVVWIIIVDVDAPRSLVVSHPGEKTVDEGVMKEEHGVAGRDGQVHHDASHPVVRRTVERLER